MGNSIVGVSRGNESKVGSTTSTTRCWVEKPHVPMDRISQETTCTHL